jgi:hypothetical protein
MGFDLNGQAGLFRILRQAAVFLGLIGVLIAWAGNEVLKGIVFVVLAIVVFTYAQIRYRTALAAYKAKVQKK